MYLLIGIGLVLFWGSSLMPSVSAIITASVNAVAIQVAYYYGLAGLVAAWSFRGNAGFVGWRCRCSLALSGLTLIGLGVYAITTFNLITQIVGVGGFALGILFFGPAATGARSRQRLSEDGTAALLSRCRGLTQEDGWPKPQPDSAAPKGA